MTEEQRAAAYLAQIERRKAWELANKLRLAGSPVARLILEKNWQPVMDWQKERNG